eukprot:m.815442 g.815442  ORF g.815442 m.815442 type:complete len:53 (-) comp59372_c0_seq1:106-264(-)
MSKAVLKAYASCDLAATDNACAAVCRVVEMLKAIKTGEKVTLVVAQETISSV